MIELYLQKRIDKLQELFNRRSDAERIINEANQAILNIIVASEPVVPAKKERKKRDLSGNKSDNIRKLLKKGKSVKQIVSELGVSSPFVYTVRSNMNKDSIDQELEEETAEEELDEEELADEDEGFDDPEEGEEVSIVDKIKRMFSEERLNSMEICKKLKISISELNRLIIKHHISRASR